MPASEFSLPFYEDVLEFLASGPSVQQLIAYGPAAAAQQRFSSLLEADRMRPCPLQKKMNSTTMCRWTACCRC